MTTNSISQLFQRKVVERRFGGKTPLSLIFAVPDHPWIKAGKDSAAVRISMTVAEAGNCDGLLREVVTESGLDTDEPALTFNDRAGKINADLTVGIDVNKVFALLANEGISSPGVKLHGAGFIVTPTQAGRLGLNARSGLELHIRQYRNGRDLTYRSRGVMVIDLDGLSAEEVRSRFPEVYQHLLEHVKPERDLNNEAYRKQNWWLFGRRNTLMRSFTKDLKKFIVTVETTKHRVFQFLDVAIAPDNMLIAIGSEDGWIIATLSSNVHTTWAPLLGGWLGYGNDPGTQNRAVSTPFPFPNPHEALKQKLNKAGEALDAHRKRVLAERPDLTLTGLYNVLEKLKAGTALTPKEEDVKDRGLVLILKELHEEVDRLTAEAYGWPVDLSDDEILARLVALNAERAKEEAAGLVRWLRPEYQIPRFGKGVAAAQEGKTAELDLPEVVPLAVEAGLPAFPADRDEHPFAVERVLRAAGRPMTAAEIARGFKRGGKKTEQRVTQVLGTLVRYGRVTHDQDRYAA